MSWKGWVATGLAVAGVGAGIYTGIKIKKYSNDLQKEIYAFDREEAAKKNHAASD